MGAMRRALALVVAGVAGLFAAGCALPDGVDGDLTSGWAVMPEPVGFVPTVGVCHEEGYRESSSVAEYQPVDCEQPHLSETVRVGEFTGSAADRVTPPRAGSSQWRSAYRRCDRAAADYLGGDFRDARLWLGVTVPATEAWEGGARWYRCEVVAFDEVRLVERSRTGSLAGGLASDSGLRLGCFQVTLDDNEDIDQMIPTDCDQPHQAQYAGLWEAPAGDYPDGEVEASAGQVYQGCREQVAAYAGVPVDFDLPFRTGTIADWMEAEDWYNGDRKFRCYLWLNGDEITGSLRGQGTAGLPIR